MKVVDFVALPDTRDRSIEARGVALEGYLLGFKLEGPESPNCYAPDRHDFQMWLGGKKPATNEESKTFRVESVVVEPTPLMQDKHPTWTKAAFMKLLSRRIRVTGWMMFDPEHPEQIGKTRATLWEVHPVMKIEVFQGGQWVEF